MKVIVAGGRDFNDYDLLESKLDSFFRNQPEIEIVSGKARGADTLGEQYAKKRGYEITPFPADWSNGKSGGHERNKRMAEYADACVAFWDGKSRGTKSMINLARAHGLQLRIVLY